MPLPRPPASEKRTSEGAQEGVADFERYGIFDGLLAFSEFTNPGRKPLPFGLKGDFEFFSPSINIEGRLLSKVQCPFLID
jgi:hypothetical protein